MQNTLVRTFGTHRDLLVAWTFRILRARYQQSFLGFLWAILQPAAQVLVFTIIFTTFVQINTGNTAYVLFSSVAMVPWAFFSNSLNDMVGSLVENMSLVTKIYFPREIFPLSALLARFADFLISSIMVVLLMLYFGTQVYLLGLIFLPLIVLVQMTLALGIGLIGAAINVFYRDIKHLFTLGLQLWLYASPVIYPIDRVPERFRSLYYLNPMAGVITSYRDVLLYQQLPSTPLLISAVMAVAILVIGYWFFKRVEFQFADVV